MKSSHAWPARCRLYWDDYLVAAICVAGLVGWIGGRPLVALLLGLGR